MPKGLKIKCRTRLDEEQVIDDEQAIRDFLRDDFLKFYMSFYKVNDQNNNNNNEDEEVYMMDVFLVKGTQLVFIDLMEQFLKELYSSTSVRKSSGNLLIEEDSIISE